MTKHTKWKSVASLHGKFARDAERERIEAVEIDKPLETVMHARARQMGRKPSESLLSPMLCDQAGQAIRIGAKDMDEARKMWDTFCTFDAVHERFCRRVLNVSRHPPVSKMEFMPERMETRADDRPDLRTEDEKIRDARNAMSEWDSNLSKLQRWQEQIIRSVSRQCETLHVNGNLTNAGISFVSAMRQLLEVVR